MKSGNVAGVAYGVGFNTLSYFSRCFREEFGMSPKAWTIRNRYHSASSVLTQAASTNSAEQ
jgi:AraC-like DNA-binding protein